MKPQDKWRAKRKKGWRLPTVFKVSMGKITGAEKWEELPEKVLLLYQAVMELIAQGEDMSDIKVSMITQRAGIGKGTAYDYFDSKEEMIICAVVYLAKKITSEIHEGLMRLATFSEQMAYLLDKVEEKLGEQKCFLRFVHMMTDTSSMSQMLRERLETEPSSKYLPLNTLEEVLRQAIRKGQVREDLPMDYMIFSICSRLVTYMGCISTQECTGSDPSKMRPYVYQGILEEFSIRS